MLPTTPMPARHDSTPAREISVAVRLVRVAAVMVGIAAVVAAAVAGGAISLPRFGNGSDGEAGSGAVRAARREAADRQWAAATCTNILDWKDEIQRDGTSLDPGLGPSARVEDAIAATGRLLSELNRLGLPPAAQNPQARAEIEQLRSEIGSSAHAIQGSASSVASGNLLAIGTLVGDLASDRVLAPRIAGELRRVVSVDLGLSLVETPACRQLIGIPL